MAYSVETVLTNVTPGVGEGPHWDDATQTLLFVDITGGDIHRYDPNTGNDDVLHLNGQVGFVVPRHKGGLVAGLDLTISSVEWASNTVTTLSDVDKGSNNRVNDGKCDAKGRLWFGTMSKTFELDKGDLYCLDTDGTLKKKDEKISISNGLAWSSDNKTMYYIDSMPHVVYAYDYNNDTGDISNRRVAVDFNTVPEFQGNVPGPDGMTIDTDGNLWVACFNGGCVGKFDPNTGKLLERVNIPDATRITSVCWGGKNHDELYVTSLRTGLRTSQLETTDSRAGSLFRVTSLGAKGSAATIFQGSEGEISGVVQNEDCSDVGNIAEAPEATVIYKEDSEGSDQTNATSSQLDDAEDDEAEDDDELEDDHDDDSFSYTDPNDVTWEPSVQDIELQDDSLLVWHRTFNQNSIRWRAFAQKEEKSYSYITDILTEIFKRRIVDTGNISRRVELMSGDPRRLSATIAPVPPSPTEKLVEEHKSRFGST